MIAARATTPVGGCTARASAQRRAVDTTAVSIPSVQARVAASPFKGSNKFFSGARTSVARARNASSVQCNLLGNLFGGAKEVSGSMYDFTVKDIDGKDVSLSAYKGKVCVIVNVASA